ncbi:MAG: DUF4912 domain-containing protein [Planctomycetota bacterium]|nr:MAG: DUF4912 domain-containing protein [Planctomycetota bacterium]
MTDGMQSSGERFRKAPKHESRAEDGNVYIDWGPPLPESYHQDVLYGLVRDPKRIFFYWELTGSRRRQVEDERGIEIFNDGRWELAITNLDSGETREFGCDYPRGSYYAEAAPRSAYVGKIGWRTAPGEFILFCETPPVRTPSDGPSDLSDQEFWSALDLRRLLDLGGASETMGSFALRSSMMASRTQPPKEELS